MATPQPNQVRGRGAGSNPANRFERLSLEVLPETVEETHREHPGGVQLPTEVFRDDSRRVINRVDSPDLGFNWTINPYRGCEHGCSYCMSGETRILMADGTSKQLGDLQVGEEIYGTVRDLAGRRVATTRVLDHWEVTKPAYRVTLECGTSLIASGDHRFLTDRGWKYVTGDEQGAGRRPHLTTNNRLIGIAAPEVVEIAPLREARLFDITTGTGDFFSEGVVSHNCYARPTHEMLGFSCGLDFETKIVAKPDAPRLLRAELSRRSWRGEPIAMSGVTDCYQPLETRLRVTRSCLEVMASCHQPVSIVTKNRLVVRDLDLLGRLALTDSVLVTISLTTLDKRLAATMEPRASAPADRLRAIRELSAAGVPVAVLVAPVIPGLNDAEIPALLAAAAEAGACSATWIMLRLPQGVDAVFFEWVRRHLPDRAARIESLMREVGGGRLYDPTFGVRGRGHGPRAEQIRQTFTLFARRHGLDRALPPPSSAAFVHPDRDPAQMGLWREGN